jgi:hypothetical protein
MNFLDSAPMHLVERYNTYPRPRAYGSGEYPTRQFDPDEHIAQLLKEDEKFKQMSKQRQDSYRTSLSRLGFGLPPEMGKELLGTLITDLRMAPVWASLRKKINEEAEFLDFWDQCQRSILGWSTAPKRTAKEREDHFRKIGHLALELSLSMNETEEFQHFSTAELISSESLDSLRNVLSLDIRRPGGEDNNDELTRFALAEGMPSIHQMLDHIAAKALQCSMEPPIVRKPNSENASVHYFVRTLSRYLRKEYQTPMYEVVAATAGVIFDLPDIDLDYVSKLVRI